MNESPIENETLPSWSVLVMQFIFYPLQVISMLNHISYDISMYKTMMAPAGISQSILILCRAICPQM